MINTNSNIIKLLSNYGTRIWSMVSVFIFIPIYIKILGIENYAIIGYYSLILGFISFADAGLSSAVMKEFSLEEKASYKYSVFKNIEKLYIKIVVLIILLLIVCAPLISKYWLNSETISKTQLSYYVVLIAFGTALQLLSSLYYGALFGIGDQVKSNLLQIIWNIIRTGLVIIPLLLQPNIETYLYWQIFCNLLYVIILRAECLKVLKKIDKNVVNYLKKIPSHIVRYVVGMTAIAVISAVNSQSDKIIISSVFNLKTFGYYNLSSILAQIPVIVSAPLGIFIFPLYSKYSNDNSDKVDILFKKITNLLSIIVLPVVMIITIFTEEILSLWASGTIDKFIYNDLVKLIRFLSIGSLFLAFQYPFFYLLLSKNKTKYTIYQGIVQILLGLPMLYIFTRFYGIVGASVPWIFINFGALIFLSIIVFKYFININFFEFLQLNFFLPFAVSLLITLLFYFSYKNIGGCAIFYILCAGSVSFSLNVICGNILKKRSYFAYKHLYNFPHE